jgi:regulator of cell morphogenesis and NO signaling
MTEMQTAPTTTVRDIASESLGAVRVFERFGIDYCCGGKRPLADVCREKGYSVEAIQIELDSAMAARSEADQDWSSASLCSLIRHIVFTHHEYLRRELPAIGARLTKVYRVYNQRSGPTLTGLPEVFAGLKAELESHLAKEELILFPAIEAYETAANAGAQLPRAPFGKVSNPIAAMEHEHDSVGQALARIREITGTFHTPESACVTYRALMSSLDELERDLHMHIHLENNILFPRASELESSLLRV